MKLDKEKNAKRGIAYGLLNHAIVSVLPFLVQAVTIRTLGIEYVGIKGLFSSILTMLSLTELGIGSAIVYSMYKPIAEDNLLEIGALLNLYKHLYRKIGLVILVLGLAITPFLKFMIKGDYPEDINIQGVFVLYLLDTVISYWMYAYKSSLLNAFQRMDVISIIATLTSVLMNVFQIIFLLLTRNFYIYLCISILFTIINNVIISISVDRMYPEIKCLGEVADDEKKVIKTKTAGVLIGRVCGTTRNTFDTIFISAFLGLTQAAMYSNYFYILTALNRITSILSTSLLGGIGNSIVLESKERNYRQMMILHTLYMGVFGWVTICLLCLYQPFISIWVGQDSVFSEHIMILFPIYFYIAKLGDVRGIYSDAAGLFWENRYRAVIETVANIALNYIFLLKWGVFGIILATILTLFFIGFIGSTIVIFKHYFEHGMKRYITNTLYCFFSTFMTGLIAYYTCSKIVIEPIYWNLFFRVLICITVVPAIYLILIIHCQDFKEAIYWLRIKIKPNCR